MNTSVQSESIPIIGEQIAATLKDAHLALEHFVDGGADVNDLQVCAELLHSVRGALQIAEIYGAGLLAEEMEATCQFLADESKSENLLDDGLEVLSRAMVQLPSYVEQIIAGGRDVPLVLLPLLNDLRAVRANPLLSESTLLLLKLQSPVTSGESIEARAPSGEKLADLLVKYRPQFQLGLLGWIKDSSSELDLQRMASVAEHFEHAAAAPEIHQLWWVVGGVLEALIDAGLDSSVALKRLLGQADREIKRLQEESENVYVQQPPTSLINSLLYYVARSRTTGKRGEAIRAAFNLEALVPGDEQVEQLRESLAAPSPKLMKTVADAIREDLAKTKDVLDIFVRKGMRDATDLQPHVALLGKIGDTLGVLGLGSLREKVQKRSDELQSILAAPEDIDVSALIALAAALLDVEDRLDGELNKLVFHDSDTIADPVDPELQNVTQAVIRECMVNLARAKEIITEMMSHPNDLSVLDGLDGLFSGINAGFSMLRKTRVVETLERVRAAVGEFVRPDLQFDSQIIDRLADAIVSLECYMETMAAGRKEPVHMLENAERCLGVIENAVPVAVVEEPQDSNAHAGTQRLDVSQLADSQIGQEHQDKTEILKVPAFSNESERPDPEILELFIEEAGEEIVSINRHLPVWIADTGDAEALITLRRSFHTLKGSGRMVGATVISEFGWSIEDLLNRLINKTLEPGAAVVAFAEDAVAALPKLLEQFEAGTNPPENLDDLIADAGNFANGEIPQRYAAVHAAAMPDDDEPEALEVTAALKLDDDKPSLDPVLLEILEKETAGHIDVVRQFVERHSEAGDPVMVSEEVHRACHTLKGSMTMAHVELAVEIAGPLYELVESHYRRGVGLAPELISLCNDAAQAIERVMLFLANPTADTPDFSDLRSRLVEARISSSEETLLQDVLDSTGTTPNKRLQFEEQDGDEDLDLGQDVGLTSDSDIEELLPPTELDMSDPGELLPSEIPGSAEYPADASAHSRPVDAEIAAIFAEEATEILEAADKAMEQLSTDARDPEPLAELQRHLHTLKGGARMAGVVTMGDFSHELESLLLRIIQGGMGLDDAGYSLMQASFDELHRMHDQVLTGVIDPPGAELLERLAMAVEATMMMPVLVQATMQQKEIVDVDAIDATDADQANAFPVVPEPEKLGELARELTQGKAPDKPSPLPDSILSGSPRQLAADSVAPRREVTRVDATMLEEMLNNAGEISISHSRLSQQTSSIQFNLEELGTTVFRLQQQLRLLEMETEAQILFKHQAESATADDFDPLEMDRYSTIQQLSRALVETANDVNSIKELLRNLTSDAETILLHQKRTTSAMQDSLMRTRMVPFDQHVPRLSRLVRQQAAEAGKQVELKVEGSSGELDRQVMEKMLPPFEHMLRNAIIHGIETPDIRAAAGKSETGTITIRFRRQSSEVLINVIDDGAGLNLDAVRSKALERGVLQPDQSINDEELAQLIFHSGLSTASQLTQSAGRGIGMDVVVSEVAKLGGRLTIQTEAGKSCTFTVRLPYTLAITQAFIVRLGNESFALPVATVGGVTRISRQQFEGIMREDVPVVEHRGRHYRLRHLGMFVGLGAAKFSSDAEQIPLILVDAGDNSTALIVDETAVHREIVVKPIGALLSAIRGVSGATILGDGSIVMILDVGAIMRDARIPVETDIPVEIVEEHMPPLALVVDDSITMRRVTQRLLERNGLRVLTAKDGVEALEVLQEKTPDIIVLDIEMPRMDGYELAKHVRNSQSTAKLPIIMVTSRVGEKHRARAIELGVNDYLGKPYQEYEMLDAIRNILGDDIFGSEGSTENDE